MYFDTKSWLVLSAVCACACARGWSWPEGAESVRIDTKVRFVDDLAKSVPDVTTSLHVSKRGNIVQSDEAPFREPTDTGGFYNRPPGAGRYPVRVTGDRAAYRPPHAGHDTHNDYREHDGTLDSVQFCKCVSTPDCNPRHDSAEVCGTHKYLCCFKRPNGGNLQNTEFFNEIDDERPMLFPGKENIGGPFPPPSAELGGYGGHGHQPFDQGAGDGGDRAVLVGPVGPSGVVGPAHHQQPILFGPAGPSGIVGPSQKAVLAGPDGPTGVIGPAHRNHNIDSDASAQRGILVGPGGPTGVVGPYQRPVLTGPGGPTGNIGPGRGGNRGVLAGPGGPTGIIGPYGRQGSGYGRQSGPGLLVGPGGPTGIIGPGRQLLVGPGGPTGHIGPQRYYDYKLTKESRAKIASEKTNTSQITEEKKTESTYFGTSATDAVIPRPSRVKRNIRKDQQQRRRQVKKHRSKEQHKQKKWHNRKQKHDLKKRQERKERHKQQKQNQQKEHTKKKRQKQKQQREQKKRLERTNPNQQKKRQTEQQKREQVESGKESGGKRGVRGCTSCAIQPAAPRRRPVPPRRRPASDDISRPRPAQRSQQYAYDTTTRPPHKPGQIIPKRYTTTSIRPIWKRMKYAQFMTFATTTSTVKPSPLRKFPIFYAVLKIFNTLILFGMI